jgi:hypothetical protein
MERKLSDSLIKHPKAICIGTSSKKGSSKNLGTVRNWASFLDGTNARPEPIRFEIRNDRPKLLLAMTGLQMYRVFQRVYPSVHF